MATKKKTAKRKLDKYDKAIAYLKKNPEMITSCWNIPNNGNSGGCLFQVCSPTGNILDDCFYPSQYGCPTQVASREKKAFTREITLEIRQDTRIPRWAHDITVKNLHVFAEWQRRLDKELNRK
jgi:hypothetical protein